MKPETLVALRKRHHLTQAALARQIGVGRRSLSDYETGKAPVPKLVALACAAVAFGLPGMD